MNTLVIEKGNTDTKRKTRIHQKEFNIKSNSFYFIVNNGFQ